MLTETQAQVQLVESILYYNTYYDNIRKYLKKKNITHTAFAYDLVNNLSNGIPNHSIYYMLDNIENVLGECEETQEFDTVQDFLDFLYDNYLWLEDN